MDSFLGAGALILSILMGLVLWTFSEISIILRETAINRRDNPDSGPKYRAVGGLSAIIQVVAILVVLIGVFAFLTVAGLV
jgi:hypothetical protein